MHKSLAEAVLIQQVHTIEIEPEVLIGCCSFSLLCMVERREHGHGHDRRTRAGYDRYG